jgi:O-acetyl-ADP-ribose deacetylase (regulator of RNase III)
VIRVLLGDPMAVEADALFRSIGVDFEACTALDDRVGARAGAAVASRLRAFGDVPVGSALVTPGGDLPFPFLFHLVLRSHEEPVSADRLRRALRNGLRHAAEWELLRVVIPPLGTGAGNLDAEAAAGILCAVLAGHVATAAFPREFFLVAMNAYEEEALSREVMRAFPTPEVR